MEANYKSKKVGTRSPVLIDPPPIINSDGVEKKIAEIWGLFRENGHWVDGEAYNADDMVTETKALITEARINELLKIKADPEVDLDFHRHGMVDYEHLNPQESGEQDVAVAVCDYIDERVAKLTSGNKLGQLRSEDDERV